MILLCRYNEIHFIPRLSPSWVQVLVNFGFYSSKVLKIVLPKANKLWKESRDCANLLVLIHRQLPRTQFKEQMVTFYNRKFKIPDRGLQTHLLRVLMWTSLKWPPRKTQNISVPIVKWPKENSKFRCILHLRDDQAAQDFLQLQILFLMLKVTMGFLTSSRNSTGNFYLVLRMKRVGEVNFSYKQVHFY